MVSGAELENLSSDRSMEGEEGNQSLQLQMQVNGTDAGESPWRLFFACFTL